MNDGWALIDREVLLAEMRQVFDARTAGVMLHVLDRVVAQVRQDGVMREDFRELTQIVADLAEAQQGTAEEMKKLAAAQARAEERVGRLEAAVERLAEAQARTEERVGRLEAAVERLAEAQAHTEERVSRLEAAVERLAEAQRQTSAAVRELTTGIDHLRKQVGGLSETVGGDIEDIAYIVLHDVLKREFGWQVGVLEREWQTWDGEPEEVNVFGEATDPARPGQVIWIVGEAKHNLTQKEVDRFARQVERARRHLVGEIFPVCFCYRARPEVQQQVHDAGIRLVFSYGKLV
jgi:predicted nuclease with TOPRIM domain